MALIKKKRPRDRRFCSCFLLIGYFGCPFWTQPSLEEELAAGDSREDPRQTFSLQEICVWHSSVLGLTRT